MALIVQGSCGDKPEIPAPITGASGNGRSNNPSAQSRPP
jgi:hypothetical protein